MKPDAFNYAEYIALKEENNRLTAAYIELLKRSDEDICTVCKNLIECKGEGCECFEQGKGGTIDGKEHPDIKWTCEDFDHGTCSKLINTPCQGCFDNDYSGFDWVGLEEANER